MAQTDSYFTLRPCDKEIGLTDPKPEPLKDLANTNIVDTGYLQDLGLPSLPPLSKLLTPSDKSIPACGYDATTAPDPIIEAMVQQQQQQQQQLYTISHSSPSITTTSPVHASLSTALPSTLSIAPSATVSAMTDSMGLMAPTSIPVTTAPLNLMIVPTADMYQHTNTTTNTTADTAALMANNPMLSSTGNPSSLYNMAPSTTSVSSPDKSNISDLPSYMVPTSESMGGSSEKNYNFVAIPGANQRKRPRRRYDEIERLYHCTWPSCTKSYGTLNHLNAHVSMQKHGPKRHPSEFKEMRKNWRRQKKEREAAKKAADKEGLASGMVNPVNANMATGTMMQPLQSYNNHHSFPSMYASFPQPMTSISAFY